MSTRLGTPLVTKTATKVCDGQCGGEVTVTTDGIHLAYALTEGTDGDYVEQDGLVSMLPTGALAVSCGSMNTRTEIRCDGEITFEADDFGPWEPARHPALLARIEGL